MIIHSPIISGSLTFADGGTLSLPNPTAVSGSFSGSAQFSTIGSHIVPDTANTYDLGSETNYFRDLYISTGSLKGIGNGGVTFKLGGKPGGGLKVTDDSDNEVEIVAKEITLKDTSGNGNNIKLKVENGALKSKKVNNSDVEQSEEPASELSGSFTGSIRDAEFDGDATFNNGMSVTGTSALGVTNVTGLASLDGGIDVDGAFTVADSTGNVSTSGTLSAGNTDVATLDASGLASLDGGIDVDGAFTVANTSGNVSTTGTLSAGNTDVATLDASGLASLDGGIDVDGAFTVANTSGNVSTTGTLGAGNTTISGTADVTGLASLDGGIDVDGAFTVANTSGNVSTSGTLSAGNTDVATLDASGLASLDGGVDVDGAFTVADGTGNVSTSGTLGVSGTSTLGVVNASGLISADAGLDVDGAFTVADTSGNVSTSGTLGVTGLSSLGAVSSSAMDVAGHILPAAHNTYDLGSSDRFWRDLFLSSGSLYINGIQVLSTDGTDLTFQTDAGESVKILETGNDTITLESVNGDITLTATGTGNIELDAPIQIAAGKNVLSSDGNAISFASDVDLGSNDIFAANLNGIVSSSAITYDGDNITVAGNAIVSGDLTVSGTTTTVNSNTVNIGDNQIVLNSDETGTPSQNGGIAIERGTATNSSLIWNETNDYWMSGLLGAEERIVVGAGNTSITTLGTIATGTWQGTAIAHDYIGLDAIDGTNIDDDAIDSEHIADGAIDLAHMSVNSVDSDQYVDGSIDTAHIAADAVSYAKIQNVSATNRILGRDSSGAGDIEEITPANLRTMINVEDGATADQTAAEIRTAVGTGNNGVIPAEGSAGHFLKHDGTFGLPSYTTNTDTNTQNTTTLSFVDSTNDIILRNTTGGAGSGTQDIKLVAGSNITLTHTDANNFTIASTDTNTQLSTADVRGKFSAGTNVSITNGEISSTDTNTQLSTADVRGKFSAGTNVTITNGEISSTDTNTQLSTADVRGKFSAGTGIGISSGEISIGQAVGTSDDVTFASVSATGDIVAYASSDERLKDNIEVISNPIEKVQQLKGVTWDWNDNADELQKSLPNVGVIAQDVEKVLPQVVKDRDNGFKGVDYDKIVGLLIEAIKDQQTQIDELKSKLG